MNTVIFHPFSNRLLTFLRFLLSPFRSINTFLKSKENTIDNAYINDEWDINHINKIMRQGFGYFPQPGHRPWITLTEQERRMSDVEWQKHAKKNNWI